MNVLYFYGEVEYEKTIFILGLFGYSKLFFILKKGKYGEQIMFSFVLF